MRNFNPYSDTSERVNPFTTKVKSLEVPSIKTKTCLYGFITSSEVFLKSN